MSYNGSGTFNINTSGQPVVTGTAITSTAFNALTADLATGLTNAITRDGQSPATANIPMGSNKITGLAAASANGDAVRFEQLPSATNLLPIASGGTGSTTAAAALTALGAAASGPLGSSGITGAAASGANTDITSLASPAIANATATTQAAGDNTTKVATTAFVQTASSVQIQPIGASVAANALTVTALALALDFRSTTLSSGAVTRVVGTPANLVVPSGATLGTVNAVQSRIMVLCLNNAGTPELAVVNIAGGTNLTATGLISTTAISAGSTSASVVYSTTARTNVAYRVVGYIESTQATAGTWATAPSTVQGMGDEITGALASLGYGQTWQDVTGSRASGTTYYNTTGKPIFIMSSSNPVTSGSVTLTLTVNGVTLPPSFENIGLTYGLVSAWVSSIIPINASYMLTITGGTLGSTAELR